jgi:TolB protein
VRAHLTDTPELEQPVGWSPDGRRVLFTRFDANGPGADVWVVDATGRNERRLTRGSAQDVAAAWSPDGRQILFTSDRDGREQVYVMRVDGTRQRNVSRSGFADTATSWR